MYKTLDTLPLRARSFFQPGSKHVSCSCHTWATATLMAWSGRPCLGRVLNLGVFRRVLATKMKMLWSALGRWPWKPWRAQNGRTLKAMGARKRHAAAQAMPSARIMIWAFALCGLNAANTPSQAKKWYIENGKVMRLHENLFLFELPTTDNRTSKLWWSLKWFVQPWS